MKKNSKIFVAGHKGLVGSSIVGKLREKGFTNLIVRSRNELDLLNQQAVETFFKAEKPEYVFMAAAKVGGIMANSTYPADFIYENLQVQDNVIYFSHKYKVKKLLFLGSSCIYPKFANQPIKEDYLMTGPLEVTNEAYAIAKIAGLVMCKKYQEQYGDNFISAMPTNLYGPNDNFHPKNSHVMPALIMRFIEAKEKGEKKVTVWGSGNPKREFLYIEDLADALVFLMENYNNLEHVNVGTGVDISIRELAETIKSAVGYTGEIEFDSSKPDGTPRKVLDVSRLKEIGWEAKTSLNVGIKTTVDWYLAHRDQIRKK